MREFLVWGTGGRALWEAREGLILEILEGRGGGDATMPRGENWRPRVRALQRACSNDRVSLWGRVRRRWGSGGNFTRIFPIARSDRRVFRSANVSSFFLLPPPLSLSLSLSLFFPFFLFLRNSWNTAWNTKWPLILFFGWQIAAAPPTAIATRGNKISCVFSCGLANFCSPLPSRGINSAVPRPRLSASNAILN